MSTHAEILERITSIIETRHDQGITEDQMIRASGLDPTRFAELTVHGLDAPLPVATGELMELCEGLFVDVDWLLTGRERGLQPLFPAAVLRSALHALLTLPSPPPTTRKAAT